LAALGLATAFAWTAPGNGQCQYDVTQIDYPIDCGIYNVVITSGSGLNNHGAVVGSYQCALWKDTEAFLWTPEEGFTTLPRPPGVYSSAASDINDDGVIVGTYEVGGIGTRGFVYESGQFSEVPPHPGGMWSWCSAINNQRTVVGGRSIGPGINPYNAFIWWTEEEWFTDLGVMSGPNSSATAVGPDGQIVGWSGNGGSINAAFLWQDGNLTLLGPIPGGATSQARDVGPQGTVVGSGRMQQLPGGPIYGFLWRDGEFQLIDPIPGYDTSGASGINSVQQVIGACAPLGYTPVRAYVWQHGVTHDLNDLVSRDTSNIDLVGAINDQGQILAAAGIHCLLLTPVGRPLGDLDIDCKVGITDFLRLLGDWGKALSPADLNADGTVDQTDFTILIKNWG
jgi:probable HAF family extracellular repeat protein